MVQTRLRDGRGLNRVGGHIGYTKIQIAVHERIAGRISASVIIIWHPVQLVDRYGGALNLKLILASLK